jgi:transcriptional regulator with PAS, ATPase and Fis domain
LAATNRIPDEAIKEKKLREDLYYRLNVFQIILPPLRDRKDDIAPITEAILVNINKKHGTRIAGLHPSTLDRFMAYNWPGNIRELRNTLERAAIMASEGMILPKHLAMDSFSVSAEHAAPPPVVEKEREPEKPRETAPVPSTPVETTAEGDSIRIRPGATMEEIEEAYIDLVLQRTNNNKTKAADILGISVRTLHNRLGQLSNKKANGAAGS